MSRLRRSKKISYSYYNEFGKEEHEFLYESLEETILSFRHLPGIFLQYLVQNIVPFTIRKKWNQLQEGKTQDSSEMQLMEVSFIIFASK